MKLRNACGFCAGSMRVIGGASITAGILAVLCSFAPAQTIPQNTTGRNPGTQVPPGAIHPGGTHGGRADHAIEKNSDRRCRRQLQLVQVRRVQRTE